MKNKHKRRILITGATSFLGRRLVKKLKDEEDILYLTALNEHKDLPVDKLDLQDIDKVKQYISAVKPDIVYHLAALVDLSRDFRVSLDCLEVNVRATLILLEALRKNPPKKLIFSSTEEIYGDNSLPFRENQIPLPPSSYSISKVAAENYCQMYSREIGFELVILRLATFFGPEQPMLKYISQLIVKALKNEEIPLNTGLKKRDYVYVDDVVEALVLSNKINLPKKIQIINIGGGRSYRLKQLAEAVVRLAKSRSKLKYGAFPDRVSEADEWLMDISKAREILEWEPLVSLEKGLKNEIEYFKKINA